MTSAIAFESIEEGVYRLLREDIFQARLAPGARLPLEFLARRFGVSLTPVRHALRRLEGDGLVMTHRGRGASVAPLDPAEVEEIQAIRLGVETRLARIGAAKCTTEALEGLEHWRAEMEAAYERGDLRRYVATFWPFRNACYVCADRPRLLAVSNTQRQRVERYVLFLCQDLEIFADLREHQDRFLAACRKGDPDLAETTTRAGLLWVLDGVLAVLAGESSIPKHGVR